MDDQGQERGQDVKLPIRLSHRHGHHRDLMRATQAELDAPCARWTRVLPDGSFELDFSKLKCLLSQDERDDRLLVRNVIHGTILSARIYPLIFDTEVLVVEPMVRLRSLGFFRQLLEDPGRGAQTYQSLNEGEKTIVGVGVRDLFLAAERGLLDSEETRILRGMMGLLDETLGCIEAMGMNLSFHPSTNFRLMKLLDLTDDAGALGPEWSPLFAQVMDVPALVAVFVDPVELSYHNMENIVPLDSWFEWKLSPGFWSRDLSASLEDVRRVQGGREVWTCKLQGTATCGLLKQVSELQNLYTTPPNKASRGGERFIFHSAHLSEVLTKAVKNSDLLRSEDRLAQGRLASSFEFVNYVFRCNKFATKDGKFVNHRDTPYYDGERSHVSKYTLLIYLTTGRGDPVLRVEDVDLGAIDEEMTCVIFDQSYEHEGKPFLDNEKIFIRSELVFKDTKLHHSSVISSLFNEACYMTRQSLFNEELESYAQDCFERANSLHWAIEREASQPPVYLCKQFRGIQFLTNGYDYWFPKSRRSLSSSSSSPGPNEIDCAAVAVLDFVNCKIDGKPFNSLCDDITTVRERFQTTKHVFEYLLRGESDVKAAPFKRLGEADLDFLIKKGPDGKGLDVFPEDFETSDEEDDDEEDQGDRGDEEVEDGKDEEEYEEKEAKEEEEEEEEEEEDYFTCCPDCQREDFDAWRSPLVRRSYRKTWQFTRSALSESPLLIFNHELVINESSVKVDGDKIFFLRGPHSSPRPRINFAGCWDGFCGTVPEYMGIDQEIGALSLQVPPVLWHEYGEGYHLVLELFRNDWMAVRPCELKIPVPVLTNDKTGTEENPMYIKRLHRVYRSGEFGSLFNTLEYGLDSASSAMLDNWYSSDDDDDEDEDKDKDARTGA